MKRRIILTILIFCLVTISYAKVPHLINYQGFLTDKKGKPLEGMYDITFRIYDAETGQGEMVPWEEVHPGLNIQGGIFSVLLGSIVPLDLPFDKSYWLAIKVGGDPEMIPRQQIASSAYAFRAEVADTALQADNVDKINGKPVIGVLQKGDSAGGDLVGTYPNPTIADGAIHQPALYTATGSCGGVLWSGQMAHIKMNDYCFFPNLYLSPDMYITSSPSATYPEKNEVGQFEICMSPYSEALYPSGTYGVRWRYVAASDPEHWIFIAYNKKEGKMERVWEAEDHPFMLDNSFPNPFDELKDDPNYEIYLIDNDILDELEAKITRTKSLSDVIFEEYEIDTVSIPIFDSRTIVEFDEWGDRKGEVIKEYKGEGKNGSPSTLKKHIAEKLPSYIKYRRLKKK